MSLVSTATDLVRRALTVAQAAAPLALRVLLGHAFFLAGRGKWAHFDGTVEFFTNLGIPAPALNASFIASLELLGGLALIIGLGTRVFAALLSSTMVVALLTAERANLVNALTGGEKSPTEVTALVYLVMLAMLVGTGPGALSVDRFLVKPLRARLASMGVRW